MSPVGDKCAGKGQGDGKIGEKAVMDNDGRPGLVYGICPER